MAKRLIEFSSSPASTNDRDVSEHFFFLASSYIAIRIVVLAIVAAPLACLMGVFIAGAEHYLVISQFLPEYLQNFKLWFSVSLVVAAIASFFLSRNLAQLLWGLLIFKRLNGEQECLG